MEDKLVLKELNDDNFDDFENDILKSELAYPEKIRSTKEDLVEIVWKKGRIALVGYLNGGYVGNIIGSEVEEKEYGEYNMSIREKTVYIYNIVVENKFRGKGFGRYLLQQFVNLAREKGFQIII